MKADKKFGMHATDITHSKALAHEISNLVQIMEVVSDREEKMWTMEQMLVSSISFIPAMFSKGFTRRGTNGCHCVVKGKQINLG